MAILALQRHALVLTRAGYAFNLATLVVARVSHQVFAEETGADMVEGAITSRPATVDPLTRVAISRWVRVFVMVWVLRIAFCGRTPGYLVAGAQRI